MKFTDEQLLQEAAKKYPIGTVFYALAYDGSRYTHQTIPKNVIFTISSTKSKNGGSIVRVTSAKGDARGWVYADGVWADIVKYPANYNTIKNIEYEIY